MKALDDLLQHHGVKGMRWGVSRNRNRPGGADGVNEGDKNSEGVRRNKIQRHLDSMKRERQWNKVIKGIDKLTTQEINTVKKRVDLENDLKKLSKSKLATRKDRDDYLRREKMSDQELTRKVNRLRAKENLRKSVRSASKEQREFGEKVVQVASSVGVRYAISRNINTIPRDIFDASKRPKESYDEAKKATLGKVKNPMTRDLLGMAISKIEPSKDD